MEFIEKYIEENKDRFLEELFDFIRIRSVSAKSECRDEMTRAATYVSDRLKEAGADRSIVFTTSGNPVVFAEKIINGQLPTILVYGHYDVQPPEPLGQWKSEPFEPEIRDGKIFARGADDDKGQLFMQLKAFELLCRTGKLPCNVRFMIEGEEEIGSPNIREFCSANRDMLKSDIILISDTTMISVDTPSITVGLRGLCYFEIEVTGANRDLHSGIYGGAVPNPALELTKIISSLKDNNNRITIPGFYDDVMTVSDEERALLSMIPFDLENYKRLLEIDDVSGEKGFTTIERTGIRPCLDVCGMWSGYTGEGSKTIIPSKAYAKISMRIVPDQKSNNIARLFEEHIQRITPQGVRVKVTRLHGGEGYVSPVKTHGYISASKAILKSLGKKPIPVRSGGSIPIVADFEEILGVKSILLGFGLDTDAIHSPNENFPLLNFYKGIETIALFYIYFSGLDR